MNSFILRSHAVYDGISNNCRPMAIYVKNDKIEKILPWAFEEKNEYKDIPLIDVGENMIMPSFIDAHTHIFSGAISASDYVCSDLDKCHSENECAEMIYDFAASHPDLKRIRGMGWFVGSWNNDHLPNKKSLDKLLPDIPVYLECADAHSMWLNSAALKEAGIHPDPDFPNGIIETFPNGELTGMLIEPAAYAPAMEKFMDFYKGMFFNKKCYGKMFDLLLENQSPLYLHCTAGKDRTGVGAILILLALGVRRKDAEQDYLFTNVCLKEKIDQELLKHQKELEINPEIEKSIRGMYGVDYKLIGGVLDQIEIEFGGYTNFLNEVFELDKDKLTKLRQLYTE